MIWLIITVFALAILAALTMFILDQACGFVQQVPGGVGVPEDVKKICEYYVKLKGGCFESGKKEEEKDSTTCIGKDMEDKVSTTVELNGIKSKSKVEKKLINEIIKAGKEAKVGDNIIRFVIAINPGLSDANGWEDGQSSTCWGIALLCAKDKDDYYYIATKGLDVKVPEDFVNSPLKQMKAIKVLYDYLLARINAKTIPSCVQDKIKDKKDDIYKVAYIWYSEKCDDLTQREGFSKARFADLANNNFISTACPEFIQIIQKVAFYENLSYEDRPYKQENTKEYIANEKKKLPEFLSIESLAFDKPEVTEKSCAKLKEYKPFFEAAAAKFSQPKFPISANLLAALVQAESFAGTILKPEGCNGKGDTIPRKGVPGPWGHGLVQADFSSQDTINKSLRNDWPEGEKLQVTFASKDDIARFGAIAGPYVWNDCAQNIMYGAAHLAKAAQESEGFLKRQLIKAVSAGAKLNIEQNADGSYKDIKVRKLTFELIISANNAGASHCGVTNSGEADHSCTFNKNYGKWIAEFAYTSVTKCIGGPGTFEDLLNNVNNGSPGGAACDTNGSNLNALGAEFPLVTKKGSGIKIYYSQPYPEYIGGGYHAGIDVSPGSNSPVNTSVISTFAGTVVALGDVVSTSCNVTCRTKPQRYIVLQEDGTGLQTTAIHLNNTEKPIKGVGEKVTKGEVIGQIDDFMFIHLHYETRLNGVLQNPITQIKGFNQALQASNVRAESSIIDPALYEKL
jgi:hypothetical protein